MTGPAIPIPFDRGGAARLPPWLVALMVFLASLSLAAVMTLQRALSGWDASLAGTMTVELPPAPSPPAHAGQNKNPAPNDGNLAAALALLRATPGISAAEPLGRDAVSGLIAPFLGNAPTPDDLELPILIDVRIDRGAAPDLADLKARLDAASPGAIIDDHRLWLRRLVVVARLVRITPVFFL